MTDNQFDQLFGLVNKCVNGIQRLEEGQAKLEVGQAKLEEGQAKLETGQAKLEEGQTELRKDVDELKKGQARIEKELQITNRALNDLAGESVRVKARIEILEQKELSN